MRWPVEFANFVSQNEVDEFQVSQKNLFTDTDAFEHAEISDEKLITSATADASDDGTDEKYG